MHNKPLEVRVTASQAGLAANTTTYRYGPNREVVSRTDQPAGGAATIVHHVGDLEAYQLPNEGNQTQIREYKRNIGGFLIINMRTAMVGTQLQRTSNRRYVFQDLLGSTDVLTDEVGVVLQRMSFDVWGQRRGVDWTAFDATQLLGFNSAETRRGYTGHQELDRANLIHMRGRIYDPALGRFLSPDPFVQAPSYSQSFNRYSYVLNNPMNNVDPSGYFWQAAAIYVAKYIAVRAATWAAFQMWGHSSGFRDAYQLFSVAYTFYSLGGAVEGAFGATSVAGTAAAGGVAEPIRGGSASGGGSPTGSARGGEYIDFEALDNGTANFIYRRAPTTAPILPQVADGLRGLAKGIRDYGSANAYSYVTLSTATSWFLDDAPDALDAFEAGQYGGAVWAAGQLVIKPLKVADRLGDAWSAEKKLAAVGDDAAEEAFFASKQAARTALDGPQGIAANRFFRDAAKNAQDFRITALSGGGKRLEFFSPARNEGYGKLYVQEIDGAGAIVREFKNTIGPKGLIETKWLHGGP